MDAISILYVVVGIIVGFLIGKWIYDKAKWADKKRALDSIGLKEVEDLVEEAKRIANKKLHSSVVSFNLLSGLHAMMATMLSVSEPGDVIMTLNNKFGGHFMTNSLFERIGRTQIHTVHHNTTGLIDVGETGALYKRMNAKILYLDIWFHHIILILKI